MSLKTAAKSMNSILLPLERALATAIENGGRLVGGADLDLFEKGALAAASYRAVGALDGGGTRIFERFRATQHIVDLFPLQVHLAFKLLLDAVNVGTSAAEEAHVVAGLLSQQYVGARGAKKHPIRVSCAAHSLSLSLVAFATDFSIMTGPIYFYY